MAERYRVFERAYWDHKRVIPLRWELKLFYPYFFCNKHDHISGLYTVRLTYICDETGVQEKQVTSWMNQLIEKGFLFYDWDRFVVFVPSMLERQIKGTFSPQIIKAIENVVVEFSDHPFSKILLDRYNLFDTLGHFLRLDSPFDTLSIPHGNPSDTLSGQPRDDTPSIPHRWGYSPSQSISQSKSSARARSGPEEKTLPAGRIRRLEDLKIDDTHRVIAAQVKADTGIPVDIEKELNGFKDYCLQKGYPQKKVYDDYSAGFRTRLRNIPKYNPASLYPKRSNSTPPIHEENCSTCHDVTFFKDGKPSSCPTCRRKL